MLLLLLLCSVVCVMSDLNTLLGVRCKDFVLLGGDKAFFRSIVVMDQEYNKVVPLDDHMLVAATGEQG
ncbi:unnamed protein product, partial [Chrysoparadoxa australica]